MQTAGPASGRPPRTKGSASGAVCLSDRGHPGSLPLTGWCDAILAVRRFGVAAVRRWNRLETELPCSAIAEPAIFVGNHGFGGIFDLNVFAMFAALDELRLERSVTFLTHQIAWTLGVGRLLEHAGARPAAWETALAALAGGHNVAVMPGGDVDAGKSYADRNRIVFDGRSGFARLAIDAGVPIVPIVTAGAGESLFVLSDGARLARAVRADRLLRMKVLPISVSLPWGLSVGAVGLLPYLPLPAKLRTRVLAPVRATPGECAGDLAARIEQDMQHALDELTAGRRPLLG